MASRQAGGNGAGMGVDATAVQGWLPNHCQHRTNGSSVAADDLERLISFLQTGQSAKSRCSELDCSEPAIGELNLSARKCRSTFSSLAAIRQNVLALGMPLFVGPYYYCICGPVGPLNNC